MSENHLRCFVIITGVGGQNHSRGLTRISYAADTQPFADASEPAFDGALTKYRPAHQPRIALVDTSATKMNDRYFGIRTRNLLNLNFGIVAMTIGGHDATQLRLHRDIFPRKPLDTHAHSLIDPRNEMNLIVANIDIVERQVGC